MTIKCIKFRRFEKNTLKGFASLELPRVGIILHDCTWHSKDGKEWVGFPARAYDQNGETRWMPLVEFSKDAGEARRQFQQQALDAIRAVADEVLP